MNLTEDEKNLIQKLDMFPYTVEYCKNYLNEHAGVPLSDMCTPCATFLKTVRKMAKLGVSRINEGYVITDSIHVGNTEFVLAKLDNPNLEQYVTWQVQDSTNYFWGHYTSDLRKAQRDLAERALEEYRIQEARRNPERDKAPTETGKILSNF